MRAIFGGEHDAHLLIATAFVSRIAGISSCNLVMYISDHFISAHYCGPRGVMLVCFTSRRPCATHTAPPRVYETSRQAPSAHRRSSLSGFARLANVATGWSSGGAKEAKWSVLGAHYDCRHASFLAASRIHTMTRAHACARSRGRPRNGGKTSCWVSIPFARSRRRKAPASSTVATRPIARKVLHPRASDLPLYTIIPPHTPC